MSTIEFCEFRNASDASRLLIRTDSITAISAPYPDAICGEGAIIDVGAKRYCVQESLQAVLNQVGVIVRNPVTV